MLRARASRKEEYVGSWLPEPVLSAEVDRGPEDEAMLADSVGLALLIVLETLTPPNGSPTFCTTCSIARGSRFAPQGRAAIVNGAAGVVVGPPGRPFVIAGFTVRRGKIVAMDLITDPAKVRRK
jgi:hypothetical protein